MYKYSNKKYNELLFKMGIIRIGTLYDFRSSEHKEGISDPSEGIKTIIHNKNLKIDSMMNLSKEQESILKGYEELGAFKIGKNCKNITIINNQVKKQINSDDLFIYCTASKFNIITEFEKYDSCYKITHPNEFYNEVTIALNKIKPVRFLGFYEVTYKNRTEEWIENGNKLHPALIKGLEYSNQAEIRAIWEPLDKSKGIEPIKLASYKLGKYMQPQLLI
ncbi:hypothetical protein [Aliarcobacter butzleri]|uniref:hypothetical protein n=1 Tax=Aliarcobacter butzleri TaxID=28197 RepID=UPI00125FD5BD|nr:hypothetical protein [Aliarcobacter butzleri]